MKWNREKQKMKKKGENAESSSIQKEWSWLKFFNSNSEKSYHSLWIYHELGTVRHSPAIETKPFKMKFPYCSLMINVSIRNFIPFLVPKTMLNEPSSASQMTKTAVVDNIMKVLKLLLQITLLTYKQIVFRGQDVKQTPEPWTTYLDNPKPETSWLPKL